MTETLISVACGLSQGALAFHCFEVVLFQRPYAWWGLVYYLVLAITGSMLKSSYRRYKKVG